MHVMNVAERGCEFEREIKCMSNSSLCLGLAPPGNPENRKLFFNLNSQYVFKHTCWAVELCVCERIRAISVQ